ncbi:DUF4262 domain-containing protein [Devosia sp. Leaf64]|uniref:DUF4262 domain-containing protein n=1 Tax=Devosia sp. Leaf64 TaxID=1736229 RepID=UPI0009E6CD97|nr:DUF4262 domain-containing protein [Devosia sp. Leaf64]
MIRFSVSLKKRGLVIPAMPGGYGLPPVAFTIGGAATGHPDLIMYGIAPGLAVPSLENAFSVVKERWPFPNFEFSDQVLAGYDVRFRDVSRSDLLHRTMVLTRAFNLQKKFSQTPLLQVLWPDENGVFPHESGCDAGVAACQRIKGLRN